MKEHYIFGKKIVEEALLRGEKLQKVYLQHGIKKEDYKILEKLARKNKIPLTMLDKGKIDRMVIKGNHQGVVALLSYKNIYSQDYFKEKILQELISLEDITLLYLDRIQDPQNFGALIRSAELFGVKAILFPQKESSPITPVVVKASMGAALLLPLIEISTPYNFLEELKQNGFNMYGSIKEENRSEEIFKTDFSSKNVLIIGNEEKGIKSSLQSLCDSYVYIPQVGRTDSFNASVAGGIILYEIYRQRFLV